MRSEEIEELFERLRKENPNPLPELNFTSAYTLLVAVVLSAQATDRSVNLATADLFKVADTPEKMDRYIKTIYNKANDMDRLINELTIYSKIDNNRILYNFQRINVSDYFGDCVDEVGLDLESKNIKLNFDNLIPDDTMVIADPEQMKRVINNIIGNSIKYMDKDLTKEQGMIEIRLLDDIDSIRIEIEDNGRGIAARDLGRIFERFYRTDASRNSSRGGSGIGLSIVKKIIEDHGGYIWATSKEGEGTCMHFVLRKYKEVDDDE